jgi:hypothetical protein
LPFKINFRLHDPDDVYKIRQKTSNSKTLTSNEQAPFPTSIVLQPDQKVVFVVNFAPKSIQTYEALLQMSVTDNQFEDTLVQLNGEGYLEDVTLDNMHTMNKTNDIENEHTNDDDLIGMVELAFYTPTPPSEQLCNFYSLRHKFD